MGAGAVFLVAVVAVAELDGVVMEARGEKVGAEKRWKEAVTGGAGMLVVRCARGPSCRACCELFVGTVLGLSLSTLVMDARLKLRIHRACVGCG